MKKINFLLAGCVAAALCLAACSKKEAPAQGPEDNNGPVTLSFRGDVESTPTKATATMGSGIKAAVMLYAKDANVASATPVSSKVLTSDASGNLSGANVTVLSGTYDFYAVSNNTTSAPLTFTAGSATVTNGVDYLWQKKTQAVSSTAKNVAFQFGRQAVLISITLGGTDMSFANTSMQLKPSDDTGAVMTLADGTIAPASAVKSSFVSMNMSDMIGSYVMIPLTTEVSIPVEITSDVTANTVTNTTTYQATIAAPTGGFVKGKKYVYTATVNGNQIEFSNATISDWDPADVGADGELNPSEKPAN